MQTAFITGGSMGIGLAIVKVLLNDGYQVFTCGRSHDNWLAAIAENPELAQVQFFTCDIGQPEQIKAMFKQLPEAGLDVFVNNAAPKIEAMGKLEGLSFEKIAHTANHNFLAYAQCLQQALAVMNDNGRVVNISSVNGLRATPHAAMYAAAKHGIEGLTKSVALEAIERGIRVNGVAPGVTWTERWQQRVKDKPELKTDAEETVPASRFGQPNEIADAVSFLVSNKASYIVGHTLAVDGGLALAW